MTLDLTVVGQRYSSGERSWGSKDALLYALGVGAGMENPAGELSFTTENSIDIQQQVLPTYGVILASSRLPPNLTIDLSKLLHVSQGITLHAPIPVAGRVSVTSTITRIVDKGKAALIEVTADAMDSATGQPLVTSLTGLYVRGAGGFGTVERTEAVTTVPKRSPDHVVGFETRPDQALLYRLSGDRNPLHSDPSFARTAGMDRPILHGLCLFGFAGRILINTLQRGQAACLLSLDGRFTRPVYPGDSLAAEIWQIAADQVLFRVRRPDGLTVFDNGMARFRT